MRIPKFLQEILPLRDKGNLANFADNSSCRRILMKSFKGSDIWLTADRPFDLGADADNDLDAIQESFNEIFIGAG